MPKREYIHCVRCQIPLENPNIKRCNTETWYVDFATCKECKMLMLEMENPSLEFVIDGDILKQLLNMKRDLVMMASVLSGEAQS